MDTINIFFNLYFNFRKKTFQNKLFQSFFRPLTTLYTYFSTYFMYLCTYFSTVILLTYNIIRVIWPNLHSSLGFPPSSLAFAF